MTHRFWSELARDLHPYTPGEQPRSADLVKLNTNECPYPPSERVMEAIASVPGSALLRYPDPNSTALCETIARYYGLDRDQVFIGNGSDEVLSHLFLGLLKHEGALLYPDISYSFYPVWCQLHAIRHRSVALRDDLSIALGDYPLDASAVILPNPNAPTGRFLPVEALRKFVEAAPQRLLVVDEAYVDYAPESAIRLVRDYDNIVVVQTLSKSRSLAGLRVGFAVGQAPLMEALRRVKDSFNSYPVDAIAERAAIAAIEDHAWFEDCRLKVQGSRESLTEGLQSLGFHVLPSAANFVFARHSSMRGKTLFEALRERHIIVRRWDKARIEDYLRISIGTETQMATLLAALADIIAAEGNDTSSSVGRR